MERWIPKFQREQIDGKVLSSLTGLDLYDLGMIFKERRTFYHELYKLKSEQPVNIRKFHNDQEVFKKFDKDMSGSIGLEEFSEAFKKRFHPVELSDVQVKQIFDSLDKNHDGTIDFEEFREGVRRGEETNEVDDE